MVNKKLIFYFYLTEENVNNEIYTLHYKCLEIYAHLFDEMLFVLSLDDINNKQLIQMWETKLLALHTKGSITFDIIKNNKYCESYAFKKYVVDKLKVNDLVFFGHGKGITNITKYNPELIKKWIVGMYYYNLNFIEEVEDSLIKRKFLSYGAFLSKNKKDWANKYHWFYIGTFFWLNSKKIYDYIKNNNIEMPLFCDRFYDEEFLGNIYDTWPERTATSHDSVFLCDAVDFYNYIDIYLDDLYPDREDFEYFFKKIII